MSKEKQTAEEWTKEVSPTEFGLRTQLENSQQLKHVHQWMQRYANRQTIGKDKEIAELKKENYNLLCERIESVSQAEEYKSMYANLKQIADDKDNRIKELEYKIKTIYEDLAGADL